MRRSSRLVSAVGLVSSIFAPSLLAAPPVFDHIPGNAVAVVTTPSLARFQKNADDFCRTLDAPIPVPEVDQLLQIIGIQPSKALDPQKAMAIALIPPKQEAAKDAGNDAAKDAGAGAKPEAMEMAVFILPVSNYADFLGAYDAKPGAAGGIDSGKSNDAPMYFKDIGGGFVAMAADKSTLERAQWNDADAAAHKSALGKAGDALLESSDLSWTVFTQQAKQYLPQIEKAAGELANKPGMPPVGELKNSQIGQFLTGPMMNDSTAAVAGIRVDAQGASIDSTVTFKEGSAMAQNLAGITGSSDQLLAKLPAQPFLLALAADTSSAGARKLIDDLAAKAGDKDDATAFLVNWLKNSEGASMIIGMPPGGIMNGLLTSTIAYVKTANPDAFVKSMQDGLTKLNGKSAGGFALESTYTPGGAEVDGTKVDTWGIKMSVDENSEEDAGPFASAIPALFGGSNGGPGGFITKFNGGLLQTFGHNQVLMGNALKVGNGGESFTSDKALAKVSEQLPHNRVAELYIGVKSILDSVVPLMQMNNMDIDVEIPPSLPPIGVGFGSGDQGIHLGIYLPAKTMKTVIAVAMEAQASQKGGGPQGGNGAKKNDAKKGAGQPRF